MKEDEYHNDYSRMINECVRNVELCTAIQNIRKARNQYQHTNDIELLRESDYIGLCKTVELFIRYINSTNSRGFRWKYDSVIRNIVNDASSYSNKGQVEQKVKTDEGFYFQSEDWTQKKTREIFMESMNTKKSVCYPIAYADSNLSLIVNETIPEVNKHPIWSVIHNLLVRGKTISESKYLKTISLQGWELERIYVYEILLLRFMCSSFFDAQKSILVPEDDKNFFQIAYDDIQNYYWMLNRMCGYNEIMPSVQIASNVDINSLSDGKNTVKGYLVQRLGASAPILMSSHLNYKIDETNIDCYQILLQEIFGFDIFKEGQLAAIRSILQNQSNTLVVLPTGYGKSLIYQFIAYLQPQITFVISPTKTLIMDQLLNLREMSVTNAVVVNSDILSSSIREEKRFFSLLVYVEPVYLEGENFFELVNKLYSKKILNFFAIDECHQISVWGHKFEVEYFTLLHQLICEWPDIKVLMFSATSSKRIKEDLLKQFGNRKVDIVQPCPLERKNIEYHFYEKGTFLEICNAVKDMYVSSYGKGDLYDVSGSNEEPSLSLVICNSKKGREILASYFYSCDELREVCDIFEGEKWKYNHFRNGQIRILITNDKYLSGINIPFLRNVIIVGYPPSKEWLYQESGRVGRYGEKSNVDIYTALESETFLEELLKEEYSNSISKKWKMICNNYQDLSNLEFLYSLLFDDECISTSQKSVNEISNFLYIRENAKYGTLLGKMKKQEKMQYDYALFLLFYLRIIEKWLFIDMESILEYRFYINLRYVDGPDYFTGLLRSKMLTESANEKISEKFSQILISSFSALVEIAGKWVSENGYHIRRQMYVNTYQLIKEGAKMPSDEVEKNLASYFGVGTLLPKDLPKQYLGADLERMYKVSSKNKEGLIDSKAYIGSETEKGGNKGKVDLSKSDGEEKNEENISSVKRMDECNEKAKNESGNKIGQSVPEEYKLLKRVIKDSGSDEKYSLIEYCQKNKTISETTLSYMYSLIKKTIEDKTVHFVRGGLEREIEYEDNMLCQFALLMYELIMDSSQKFFRLKDIMNQNPLLEMDVVLRLVQSDLNFYAKERVNEILKENGKKAYYYRGFFGSISKWREKCMIKGKSERYSS